MNLSVRAVPVNSLNLRFIGTDGKNLYVEFRSGNCHLYPNVDSVDLDELYRIAQTNGQESVGEYFNQRIKARYHGIPSPEFTWRYAGGTGNPHERIIRPVGLTVLAPDPVWSF